MTRFCSKCSIVIVVAWPRVAGHTGKKFFLGSLERIALVAYHKCGPDLKNFTTRFNDNGPERPRKYRISRQKIDEYFLVSKDSDILCKKKYYTIRTLTLKCGEGYPIEHLHATYRRDLRVKMKSPVNPSRIAKITHSRIKNRSSQTNTSVNFWQVRLWYLR